MLGHPMGILPLTPRARWDVLTPPRLRPASPETS